VRAVIALPGEVAAIVEERHALVRQRLSDDPTIDAVLDLDDPGAVAAVAAAGRLAGTPPSFDAIVSAAVLPRLPDLGLAVRGFTRLLRPGGVAWLIEPVSHVGHLARLQATCWASTPFARGQHLERDLPLAFRSGGFIISDLERFLMPTRTWPLRRFIQARARFEVPGDPGVAAVGSATGLRSVEA
jgi:hypothetical protein